MGDEVLRSRREFVGHLGRAAVVAPAALQLGEIQSARAPAVRRQALPGDWDLSWIQRLDGATDRAVFDWGTMGDPGDPIVLEIAARYLDNCAAVYGPKASRPAIVLNIRSSAAAAGLGDRAWEQLRLAERGGILDPDTGQSARRNPFWRRAKAAPAGMPDLAELLGRGCIVLICDFALGHIARDVARQAGRDPAEVHAELRSSRLPGAFVVPSGIFGLARAQNAGCAFVRM